MLVTNLNMVLVAAGINPIPFDEHAFTEACTYIAGFGMDVWAWWKNAPMTKEALKAHLEMLSDKIFKKLTEEAKAKLSDGKEIDEE